MPEAYRHIHCGSGTHFNPHFKQMMGQYGQFMPYDLEETELEYKLTMPLPGFDADTIDVSISDRTITVEATPPEKSEEAKDTPAPKKIVSMGNYIWNRPIQVEIPVDEEIEGDKVRARLKNGLLTVRFTKIPKKKVKVKVEVEEE
ncbi:MAG: Hsp20/alpha crystallin family protein [Promethearchaeota archaeon]